MPEKNSPQTAAPTSPPPKSKINFKSPKVILTIIGLVILVIGVAVYAFLSLYPREPKEEKPTTLPSPPSVQEIEKGKFADFPEISVDIKPKVADYKVESNFTNIQNFKDFEWLADPAKEKLQKNAFVVTQGWDDEFYPLYEMNKYGKTPNFITTDSVLHTYHLLFNSLLKRIEEQQLNNLLISLNQKILTTSQNFLNDLGGTQWENAALRNIAFFSVPAKLLNDSFTISDPVKNEVELELELIDKHGGIALSPVLNYGLISADGKIINPSLVPSQDQLDGNKEDYSQYIPRGHYEKSDLLKKYFKAMMYYGRLTFRFKNDDEIKSAILAATALETNQEALSNWKALYEVTNFFVGKSDDISYYEIYPVIQKIYGQSPSPKSLIDQTKFASLKEELKKLEPPALNSMPIFQSSIQPDREKEIKGFRFMGQRFTIDASVFQRLVCREVGNKHDTMDCGGAVSDSRMLPMGLDITAAFGSAEALNILKEKGQTEYFKYSENMEKMRSYIKSLTKPIWTQNLYWSWLYSLLPLTETRENGYPTFMKNLAWIRKQLNTFLGSWAELKHDTILYAKQVYAELGAGGFDEEKDDRGYVEPEPTLFARLAAITKMTSDGLTSRNLITNDTKETLKIMEDLCLKLKTMAEKELKNETLTQEEYDFIRAYGGNLEHLFMKALEDDCRGKDARQCLDENPAALVADVATDPNGQVLEEAIGKISAIYVIVPVEGKLKIAKGGVFSYYEFPWPMDDRLTDSKWRTMINENKIPDLPDWTQTFFEKM